jgi:hypothetical protein
MLSPYLSARRPCASQPPITHVLPITPHLRVRSATFLANLHVSVCITPPHATHHTDLASHQHTPETRDTMADADARKPDEPLKDEKEVDEQGDACALISFVPHALIVHSFALCVFGRGNTPVSKEMALTHVPSSSLSAPHGHLLAITPRFCSATSNCRRRRCTWVRCSPSSPFGPCWVGEGRFGPHPVHEGASGSLHRGRGGPTVC